MCYQCAINVLSMHRQYAINMITPGRGLSIYDQDAITMPSVCDTSAMNVLSMLRQHAPIAVPIRYRYVILILLMH